MKSIFSRTVSQKKDKFRESALWQINILSLTQVVHTPVTLNLSPQKYILSGLEDAFSCQFKVVFVSLDVEACHECCEP